MNLPIVILFFVLILLIIAVIKIVGDINNVIYDGDASTIGKDFWKNIPLEMSGSLITPHLFQEYFTIAPRRIILIGKIRRTPLSAL